jgi:FkbM family methyltransferase
MGRRRYRGRGREKAVAVASIENTYAKAEAGDKLFRSLRFADAIAAYHHAIAQTGRDWHLLERIGDAYVAQGDLNKGIEYMFLAYTSGVDNVLKAMMRPGDEPPELVALKDKCNTLLKTAVELGVSPLWDVNGWFFPRSDVMAGAEMGGMPIYKDRPVRDLQHILFSVSKARNHRVALDVGGNVGFWSHVLADHFQQVEAFEPMPMMQMSFRANVSKPNVNLNTFALGAAEGLCDMAFVDFMCGASFITQVVSGVKTADTPADKFAVKRLDDLNLDNVDFMKIDTEGFEAFVVEGGLETIKRCKPVIYVEQVWGGRYVEGGQHNAVRLLLSLGARASALDDGTNFLVEWPED